MKAETLAHYEAFALAVFQNPAQDMGTLYRKIVKTVGGKPITKRYANEAASEWLKEGHAVAKRIAEMQADIRARAEAANKAAEEKGLLPVYLSVEEKRRWLARLVRFEPTNYNPDSDADIPNGVKKSQWGTTLDIPCKISAIKLDNDLAGDGAQAKGGSSVTEALLQLVSKLRK